MLSVNLAFRNVWRQPRRTLLLAGAIAMGTIVICLAAGFSAGMEKAVQDNVTLYSGGHVIVSATSYGSLSRGMRFSRGQRKIVDTGLAEAVRSILPETAVMHPAASNQATVVFGSKEQSLLVRGVDWSSDTLYSSTLILTEGNLTDLADRSIVLGSESARRFGLGPGDTVFVKMSTASGQTNVTEYALAAVYDSAAAGGMSTAFVPLANLESDLGLKDGEVQTLAVLLTDAGDADKVAARLAEGLKSAGYTLGDQDSPPAKLAMSTQLTPSAQPATPLQPASVLQAPATYRIDTITALSGQIGAVLGSVKWIGLTIFMIMLALVAAGIANTYRMVLLERTKEIGMLRCIGFRRSDIFRIFVGEAFFIALAGSLSGMILSLPAGYLASLIRFDPSGDLGAALSRGRLIFAPSPGTFALAGLAVILASTLAVIIPARKAARLAPAEAVRKTA